MAMQLWDPSKDSAWLENQGDRINAKQEQAKLYHNRDPKDAYTTPRGMQNFYRLIPVARHQKPGSFYKTRFPIVTKWKKVPVDGKAKTQDFKAIQQMWPEECEQRGIQDPIQAAQDDLVSRGIVSGHGDFYPFGYRQTKVHVNCIDRNAPIQSNPYIFVMPWSVYGDLEPMIHVMGNQGVNIFDLQTGQDVMVTRSTGPGNKISYKGMFMGVAAPLVQSQSELEMIMKGLFDIDEISGGFPSDESLKYTEKAAKTMIAFYEAKSSQKLYSGHGQGQFNQGYGQAQQHPMGSGQFQLPQMGGPSQWNQQRPQPPAPQQQQWGGSQQFQPQSPQPQFQPQPYQQFQPQGYSQPAQMPGYAGSTPPGPGIMFPPQQPAGNIPYNVQNQVNGGSPTPPACFSNNDPQFPNCIVCPQETECRAEKQKNGPRAGSPTPHEVHAGGLDPEMPY